ncbi:DUF2158 domain-containing protein [Roseomonas terrae]|jgi:uncharacterized protein YodC (DUF2158 family)|uniref:DUF2158 domain-containing protein n=1 Tax=Neoroseomonas terrae TaxID=424799 RepID=A0ABS5EJI2_9PROT|nr:DUF2158 domain-containing protein [Neoroseomonas terrae]MBR0651179.1 DUF2158 domain-containing protein [Neoroseomonas terrae]
MDFSPGDVFKLKSGGPPMTVTHINNGIGGVLVSCAFFDGAQKRQDEAFQPEALKKVPA